MIKRPAPSASPFLPRTLQGRLAVAFVAVIAITLLIVLVLVMTQLDSFFSQQESEDLHSRAIAVGDVVGVVVQARETDESPIILADGSVNQAITASLSQDFLDQVATRFAQSDMSMRFGRIATDSSGDHFVPGTPNRAYTGVPSSVPSEGQTRESISQTVAVRIPDTHGEWAVEVTLSNPYTLRAATVNAIAGRFIYIAVFALIGSVVAAFFVANRFTAPLRRLKEATRALGAGELRRRVPDTLVHSGSAEIAELALQFNAMADRIEQSVNTIARDRDRSREFLADVSHELKTPIAAMRTFNELLIEGADEEPETRVEFLTASNQQIDRLDWLAQNLLELSKLDSGLVLLDLRPEDLRSTIEPAVDGAEAAARKSGVDLTLSLPDQPIRIRHDPQRIGQVITNLVSNALKFTPRGGKVHVEIAPDIDGAQITVTDTGVGIDANELPHIFERFYRGTRANEARGSGSGLGLAIVKSIIEMHGGRITVDSSPGKGTTFTVLLPRDPRGIDTPPSLRKSKDEPRRNAGTPA